MKSKNEIMLKTTMFILMLLFGSYYAQATIITVSNNGGVPAQYTDAQTAINNAIAGDTLFVHASGLDYGDITINKQLTIIGEGYSGVSRTPFSHITFTANTATGSSLVSLYIDGYIDESNGLQVNNITIEKCYLYRNGYTNNNNLREYFKIHSSGNNWVIRHCIVYETQLCTGYGVASGWVIANNWIDNVDINSTSHGTYSINALISATVENNIFTNVDYCLINCTNTLVKNNIFVDVNGRVDLNSNVSNVQQNNLSNNSVAGTTNGNISNTSPLFVVNLASASLADVATADLQLQANSLAKGAGVGGTDMGIHGGALPMSTDLPYDGKANKPNIEQLIILNPVVGQGQFLKFEVEAKTID